MAAERAEHFLITDLVAPVLVVNLELRRTGFGRTQPVDVPVLVRGYLHGETERVAHLPELTERVVEHSLHPSWPRSPSRNTSRIRPTASGSVDRRSSWRGSYRPSATIPSRKRTRSAAIGGASSIAAPGVRSCASRRT